MANNSAYNVDEYLLEFLRWFDQRVRPPEMEHWWAALRPYWVAGDEPGTGFLKDVPWEVADSVQKQMLDARSDLITYQYQEMSKATSPRGNKNP